MATLPFSISHVALLAVFGWLAWKLFRNFFVGSPLDRVPGPKSQSFFTGNVKQLFNRHGWDFLAEMEESYESVVKFNGMLGKRALFVYDPKALHYVVAKEQYVYEVARWFASAMGLILGAGILSTRGEHHRQQRKLLNPVFSTTHMRYMTPIFYQVAHNLRHAITEQVKDGPRDLEMLGWTGRAALELIGQGGLGHSFDPLTRDVPNPYGQAMKAFVPTLFSLTLTRFLLHDLEKIGPRSFRRWFVENAPIKTVQKLRYIADTMDRYSRDIFNSKKAAFAAGDEAVKTQVGEGKDIMSLLLRANMLASDEDRLPEEELIGQMSTFTFAATDTTSTSLMHILHLLAQNPDIQQKVREEIVEARSSLGGEYIPHDELMALPYLDAICRETLRLYPPISVVFRETVKDTVMPLSQPIRSTTGEFISEIPVPRGTTVLIGVRASNRNPALWGDDAKVWKPERWLGDLPAKLIEAHLPGVYSNLMTFNGGGRACIGFKFSQLEMKVILAVLLESFKFSEADNGDDVFWNFGGIKYPTVGENTEPECPLKVELV